MVRYDIYSDELIEAIEEELGYIKQCDDGGGIAFAYQRILDMLHSTCNRVVDGRPSLVDEFGGI